MSDTTSHAGWRPHSSHKMTEWESTIVTLTSVPRFGKVRSCKNCGAEQALTYASHDHHDALDFPCEESEEIEIIGNIEIQIYSIMKDGKPIWFVGGSVVSNECAKIDEVLELIKSDMESLNVSGYVKNH